MSSFLISANLHCERCDCDWRVARTMPTANLVEFAKALKCPNCFSIGDNIIVERQITLKTEDDLVETDA